MAQQNFRCAGCGMAVALGEFLWLCLLVVSVINSPVVILGYLWHSKIIKVSRTGIYMQLVTEPLYVLMFVYSVYVHIS